MGLANLQAVQGTQTQVQACKGVQWPQTHLPIRQTIYGFLIIYKFRLRSWYCIFPNQLYFNCKVDGVNQWFF